MPMFRHVLALLAAFIAVPCACVPNYALRADEAAATGDWKVAEENYRLAVIADPQDPGLRQRHDQARLRAISAALGAAQRCKATQDPECVEAQSTYVLELDGANIEAATLRSEAQVEIGDRFVESAKEQAGRGEYLEAVRALGRARARTRDRKVADHAGAASFAMSRPAASYAEGIFAEAAAAELEQKCHAYAECIEILKEVVQWLPERAGLLAQAKSKHTAASNELAVRQAAELAARQEADQRRAQAERERAGQQQAEDAQTEADRHRTVAVVGALASLGKSDGSVWDGFGKVPAQTAAKIGQALSIGAPYLAVANIFAEPAAAALQKPDVYGYVELYAGNQLVGRKDLLKVQDSFTPQWANAQWANVDIHSARLRIVLIDKDISQDDPMGTVEISGGHLTQARESGQVYPVPCSDQSDSQILFVKISVM